MRLATVDIGGVETCVATLRDGRALDLAAAQPGIGVVQGGRSVLSLQALIDGGAAALAAVRGVVAAAEAGAHAHAIHPSASLAFRAPIPVPRKNVFCVGRNYAEHIAEGARAQKTTINVTEVPVFFTKPPTSVVGHEAPVPIFPRVSTEIDYEVEVALIIGTRGRQFFKGKALDGSCPMGPWVVTADEIEDPMALRMQLWVNGELRQNETTAAMIFDIPALIASLSEGLTLEPGDILATGTPSGVGYAMDPPHYLQDGDEMVCEIEGIGRLSNTLHAV